MSNIRKRSTFAKFIQSYRINRGLLLGEMAERLGIGSAELSSIEGGRQGLDWWLLDVIRDEYPDINKDDLTDAFVESRNEQRSAGRD